MAETSRRHNLQRQGEGLREREWGVVTLLRTQRCSSPSACENKLPCGDDLLWCQVLPPCVTATDESEEERQSEEVQADVQQQGMSREGKYAWQEYKARLIWENHTAFRKMLDFEKF